MVDQTRPASKPCRKMKRPSWMGEFDGTLSVPGKGCFSGCFQGMSFSRGKLQLFRRNAHWMVRFHPDGHPSPYQRTLSSNFSIQGYTQERSFYKNFVQHGKTQIHFGRAAFLQFDFEDLERDEEMLKKISTVFEYFFSKDENYVLGPVVDAASVDEDPFCDDGAPVMEGNKLFAQSTLCHNLFKKQLEFPTYEMSPIAKSVSSPEIQPMVEDVEDVEDVEPIRQKMEIDSNCALYSGGYISSLLLETETQPDAPKTVQFNPNSSPKKDAAVRINGILSPSSKNNIIKNATPCTNGSSSGKQLKFLTSDQCRNATRDTAAKRSLIKSNLNNSEGSLKSAPASIPQTTPKSFYGPNRNSASRRRIYEDIGVDQSPYFSNSQRQGRGYSRLATTTAKREFDVGQSPVSDNGNAKKLRLTKQRDEKENSFRDEQGFANIHNSCYMNATLQALFSFPLLTNHLSNRKYSKIDDGLLLTFLELNDIRFQPLNARKYSLLNAFKERMIEASNNFKETGRHEDAHEYYLSFKESLQQEIQEVFPHDKAIEDILNLEMVESRMCPTCSKHSKNANVNQQTHSELGVDIPEDMILDDNFKLNGLIESTLKSSTVPFNCECGETYVDLLKRFSRLPKILVIHLHRYCIKDGITEKNSSNIDIPETLDLLRFCTKNVSTPQSGKKSDYNSDYGDDDESDVCKYQLQAVIEHLGSWASGGHYIARVRHNGMWLKCDDEVITQMDEQVADSCQQSAYLLFYIHSSQIQMNEIG